MLSFIFGWYKQENAQKTIRTAEKRRGKIKMSEDFDKPLDKFEEYT